MKTLKDVPIFHYKVYRINNNNKLPNKWKTLISFGDTNIFVLMTTLPFSIGDQVDVKYKTLQFNGKMENHIFEITQLKTERIYSPLLQFPSIKELKIHYKPININDNPYWVIYNNEVFKYVKNSKDQNNRSLMMKSKKNEKISVNINDCEGFYLNLLA